MIDYSAQIKSIIKKRTKVSCFEIDTGLVHTDIQDYSSILPSTICKIVNSVKYSNDFETIVTKEKKGVFVITIDAYQLLATCPMSVQIINDTEAKYGYRIINTDCYDSRPCNSCRTYLSKHRCPGVFRKIMLLREFLGKDELSVVLDIFKQL